MVLLMVLSVLPWTAEPQSKRRTSVNRNADGSYAVLLPNGTTQIVPVSEGRMIVLAVAGGAEIAGGVMADMVAHDVTDAARAQALMAAAVYEARVRPDAADWIASALFGTLGALGENLVGTTIGADMVKIVDDLGVGLDSRTLSDSADGADGVSQGREPPSTPMAGAVTAWPPGLGPMPAGGAVSGTRLLLIPQPAQRDVVAPSAPRQGTAP